MLGARRPWVIATTGLVENQCGRGLGELDLIRIRSQGSRLGPGVRPADLLAALLACCGKRELVLINGNSYQTFSGCVMEPSVIAMGYNILFIQPHLTKLLINR